ncbi:hypothetical protein D3C71_1066630 [compost metagenome]
MGWQVLFTHGLGEQQYFQFDVERASGLVALVEQVRQRLRIALGTCRLGTTERLQRFGGDHPRRDAGDEAFRQERPQRLVFPGLDVPCRPVVEQAETGDVIGGVANGNRVAHVVALADPDAQLQFVVQARARAERRFALTGRQRLAFRAAHIGTGRANGRRTTVVADWHVLVVRQQRVVRAEQFADVLRVLDADVEVGVIVDFRRQVHLAIRRQWQQFCALGFDLAVQGAALGEQFQQTLAQRDASLAAQFEERIQLAATGGLDGSLRGAIEQPGLKGRLQVKDMLANGHATARCRAVEAEHAQRQVLQGEVRVAVGGCNPAASDGSLRHGLSPGRVESGGQRSPAGVVGVLQLRAIEGETAWAQHLAGLEHERHGVVDFRRL